MKIIYRTKCRCIFTFICITCFFFEIKEWITTILSQCFFLLFSWIPTFVLYVGTELELPPDV